MGINIFRKPVVVRKFNPQIIVNGHSESTGHTDIKTLIDLQPLSKNDLEMLPEGERVSKGLKGVGDLPFTTADKNTGTHADILYYRNEWYKCVSATIWEHTPLSHISTGWTLIDDQSSILPPNNED